MKTLISYFSATGVTRKVAEYLSEILSADLYEIEPVEKYTQADLDWMDEDSRSSLEMKDQSARPAIREKDFSLEAYDHIIIGFPVWWYTAPMIIRTFIEENHLEEKKLDVFVTSGSSGVEKCLEDLKKEYPNLNWNKGKRLTGSESEDEIRSWLS